MLNSVCMYSSLVFIHIYIYIDIIVYGHFRPEDCILFRLGHIILLYSAFCWMCAVWGILVLIYACTSVRALTVLIHYHNSIMCRSSFFSLIRRPPYICQWQLHMQFGGWRRAPRRAQVGERAALPVEREHLQSSRSQRAPQRLALG